MGLIKNKKGQGGFIFETIVSPTIKIIAFVVLILIVGFGIYKYFFASPGLVVSDCEKAGLFAKEFSAKISKSLDNARLLTTNEQLAEKKQKQKEAVDTFLQYSSCYIPSNNPDDKSAKKELEKFIFTDVNLIDLSDLLFENNNKNFAMYFFNRYYEKHKGENTEFELHSTFMLAKINFEIGQYEKTIFLSEELKKVNYDKEQKAYEFLLYLSKIRYYVTLDQSKPEVVKNLNDAIAALKSYYDSIKDTTDQTILPYAIQSELFLGTYYMGSGNYQASKEIYEKLVTRADNIESITAKENLAWSSFSIGKSETLSFDERRVSILYAMHKFKEYDYHVSTFIKNYPDLSVQAPNRKYIEDVVFKSDDTFKYILSNLLRDKNDFCQAIANLNWFKETYPNSWYTTTIIGDKDKGKIKDYIINCDYLCDQGIISCSKKCSEDDICIEGKDVTLTS